MIVKLIFILSALCFISAFGMWLEWTGKMRIYLKDPYPNFMTLVAVIDGLVLAVVSECFVIGLRWFWVFLINLAILWWLSPWLSHQFLIRFMSPHFRVDPGEPLGDSIECVKATIAGIILFIVGLIVR